MPASRKVGVLQINVSAPYLVAPREHTQGDGLIARQRNYFDQLSFLRLNGLPMPAV